MTIEATPRVPGYAVLLRPGPTHVLPRVPDDLSGLRCARWRRESSRGQLDKQGPAAQHRMQDAAIDEFRLIDTHLEWLVAKSGWSGRDSMEDPPATRTPEFRAMLAAAAAGLFDVLLVGYSSRFIRDTRLALHYRHYFQSHGVVIWICNDRILSSNEVDFERFIDKMEAAEIYSRDHSKNVRSGYASKRADHRDPGGLAPPGFRRVGEDFLLEVDESGLIVVNRVFDLAAGGMTDREVASSTGLTVHVVRGILTNRLYLGKLQDGTDSRLGAVIDQRVWDAVQKQRSRRRTRTPGRVVRRKYALKVRCASCGRYLYGDTGRYRHPTPVCEGFRTAKPEIAVSVRGRHSTFDGHSYPQRWYEGLAGLLLARAGAFDEPTIAAVLARHADGEMLIDHAELARIARDRDEATRDLQRDRNVIRWQARMAQLDAAEALASRPANPDTLTEAEIREFLADLPRLWAEADDDARQQLAGTLFAAFDAKGFQSIEYAWTPAAVNRGLSEAVPAILEIGPDELSLVGARGFEPPTSSSRTMRATKLRHAPTECRRP